MTSPLGGGGLKKKGLKEGNTVKLKNLWEQREMGYKENQLQTFLTFYLNWTSLLILIVANASADQLQTNPSKCSVLLKIQLRTPQDIANERFKY